MRTDLESGNPLNDEKPEAQLNARRRLLRGSFAAPSVLALSSGSALAASSSLRCFNNAPAGVNNAPANYFRVPRYTLTNGTKLVSAQDVKNEAGTRLILSSPYVDGKTWINVSNGLNVVPVDPEVPTPEAHTYVALRFEITGGDEANPVFSVTGLSLDSTSVSGTGKVITGSCWSSFRPAPAP